MTAVRFFPTAKNGARVERVLEALIESIPDNELAEFSDADAEAELRAAGMDPETVGTEFEHFVHELWGDARSFDAAQASEVLRTAGLDPDVLGLEFDAQARRRLGALRRDTGRTSRKVSLLSQIAGIIVGGAIAAGVTMMLFPGLGKTLPGSVNADQPASCTRSAWEPTWRSKLALSPSVKLAGHWDVVVAVNRSGTVDLPISADVDGDGMNDMVMWRSEQPLIAYASGGDSRLWHVDVAFGPTGNVAAYWGLTGNLPVSADFDGDGMNDRREQPLIAYASGDPLDDSRGWTTASNDVNGWFLHDYDLFPQYPVYRLPSVQLLKRLNRHTPLEEVASRLAIGNGNLSRRYDFRLTREALDRAVVRLSMVLTKENSKSLTRTDECSTAPVNGQSGKAMPTTADRASDKR